MSSSNVGRGDGPAVPHTKVESGMRNRTKRERSFTHERLAEAIAGFGRRVDTAGVREPRKGES